MLQKRKRLKASEREGDIMIENEKKKEKYLNDRAKVRARNRKKSRETVQGVEKRIERTSVRV